MLTLSDPVLVERGPYLVVGAYATYEGEAAEGVGAAIGMLSDWAPAHGYAEGDACCAASQEGRPRPPYVEFVYMKLEPRS